MSNFLTKAGLSVALAATTLAVAAPAEAQRWRGRGYDRGGDVATGAIIGGLVGLGVGAAIASDNRRGFYNRGFYDRGFYGPPRRFIGPRVIYRPRRFIPRRNFYRVAPYRAVPYGYYGGW